MLEGWLMNKEIQTINQRIAEKIGHELINLIPPETLQNMVDQEIAKFKKEELPKIIKQLISEEYVNKVKIRIDQFTQSGEWNSMTNEMVNQQLVEFLGDNMSAIFSALIYRASSQALDNMRSKL